MTKSATRIQDKDTQKRLSVVQSTEDPTKYGVVLLNPDGSRIRWPQWEPWEAATVEVGSTTTWNPWTNASVSNSGDSSHAILNFTIPRGATVGVGNTTTGNPWTSASVTNSWQDGDVILNFTIPKWDKGDIWDTGNGIINTTKDKVWKVTTVTFTYANGTTFDFSVSDGQDWEGAGDVLWPSSSVDGNIVVFDGITGKLIKDSGKTIWGLESAISSNTTAISTINGKIPNEATANNQLADKDFVNSSINSVTAFYITRDAQGDQFATKAQLDATTTFYSGWVVRVPTRNDYCIVVADETHDNATTRYIYQNQWEFQYVVNETALTAQQLAALNSWITSGKVSQYDGYATNKQDTLVSGTNIKTVNGTSILGNGDIVTPNTTYDNATQSVAWLMSASDKAKLDGIASGAQVNSITGVKGNSESTYRTGNVNITKANIWLGNVDNTSDADKPISTATQSALEQKQDTLESWTNIKTVKGTSLLGSGNIAINEVPSSWTTWYVLTKTSSWYWWKEPTGWISLDANSPITVSKLRVGTEAQYSALGSYSNDTVYLTV